MRKYESYCDNTVLNTKACTLNIVPFYSSFSKAAFYARIRMLYQTIEDRQSISGDSKGCFVHIQEDFNSIPPANLSCWNSSRTWPAELWFFGSLEAAGLAEVLAKRRGRKSGLPYWDFRVMKGLLFWNEENVVLRVWTGAQGRVSHQTKFGAFRPVTTWTKEIRVRNEITTQQSQYHSVCLLHKSAWL